jgi:hypothetical protein
MTTRTVYSLPQQESQATLNQVASIFARRGGGSLAVPHHFLVAVHSPGPFGNSRAPDILVGDSIVPV